MLNGTHACLLIKTGKCLFASVAYDLMTGGVFNQLNMRHFVNALGMLIIYLYSYFYML